MKVPTLGIEVAKSIFQLHGGDEHGKVGSAIQVMLCLKRAAKISDYPVCCRLAVARQHYLDTTTLLGC
jgi:hypothetical protein